MSRLDVFARPIVIFDPSNKMHRQYFTAFMTTGSWKNCPVRFAVEEGDGMLMGQIQRKMLLWYIEQERKGRVRVPKSTRGKKSLGLTGSGFEITIES